MNEALRAHFRPEFLNRLDDQIIFHSLRREELRQIVSLQVERLRHRLSDRKLSLTISEGATDWLANAGYDPVYGARPLKRAIQREPLKWMPLPSQVIPAAPRAMRKNNWCCVD